MAISIMEGICHNGKIELLEQIPYQEDKRVKIIFWNDTEDERWDDSVAVDFFKGYSQKDDAYDKLLV